MIKISSFCRWGIIFFLTAILFILLVMFANRKELSKELHSDIKHFDVENNVSYLIDSNIYNLFLVERNLQNYLLSPKDSSLHKYSESIHLLTNSLKLLEKAIYLENDKLKLENADSLLAKQTSKMQIFEKLKTTSDSLIIQSNTLQKVIVLNYKNTKFNNKDYNLDQYNQEADTAELLLNFTDNGVVNYQKLKVQERKVLSSNYKMFKSLSDNLFELKSVDDGFYKQVLLKNEEIADNTFLDKVFDNILTIGLSLVFLIGVSVFFIFRKEKKLKKIKEEVLDQSKMKSDFLAHLSHEIRTPLNSILGFSDQLEKTKDINEQTESLEAIKKSSDILFSLVNDILDFSKIETGRIDIQSNPFNPYKAVEAAASVLRLQAHNKGLQLITKIDIPESLMLVGDEYRLKQIIINLLNNAIRFTEKGFVSLKALMVNNVLKIEIEDTGKGVDKNFLKYIFDDFNKQDDTKVKYKNVGTGLGLAICKKIITIQDGSIDVQSKEGIGSKFSFEIPYEIFVTTEAQQTEVDSLKPVLKSHFFKEKKLLIVDDNVMNIMLLKSIFKKWDVNFDEAEDGEKAFELFKQNNYDFILTDIQMPNLDGLGLAKCVRAFDDNEKSKIPIMAITANAVNLEGIFYKESGIDDVIVKPFKEELLYRKIESFLN